VRGMAEPEMCIPYMRRLAQQRTDRIIETSPNGVVILDSELHIINMNPAFQKMFMCSNGILGRRISYLVDADGYEKLATGSVEKFESIRSKNGIKYHEQLHALRDERQYVGMYTNVTKLKFDDSQLDLIKDQTIEHAKELLDHQIRFSQEMAHYLGKSTAQSEELVKRLMDLYEEQDLF
jgi:transcriptional regulator with PAS, ATPase and Fis domain